MIRLVLFRSKPIRSESFLEFSRRPNKTDVNSMTFSRNLNIKREGFTILELLLSVTIISVLAAVSISSFSLLKRRAMMAKELTAARNMMIAFNLYSVNNDGQILPGYKTDPNITNQDGEPLFAPINSRYPWRLYPYIEDVEGSLLYNGNESVMEDKNSDYLVSVFPNMGMNTTFIGGHFGSGSLLRPSARIEQKIGQFCIRHTSHIDNASDLIVFLSARSHPEDSWDGRGYFEVQPPMVLRTNWKSKPWTQESNPDDHGFVDLRWNGKAVAAMLDGSGRLLNEDELRDMRHWSPLAAEADLPDRAFPIRIENK
jgi:prepilin-type N-terminal cleavage/methylation domain-containing protein